MRDIKWLHPRVREKALKLVALAQERLGLNIIITNTLRTEEEQQALYAQGREPLSVVNKKRSLAGMSDINAKDNIIVTKAKSAKFSWHGYGLAFDIAVTDSTGRKIIWDKTSDWNGDGKDDWVQVGSLADECGLEWGGNFTGMYDPPHFQDRMGMTLAMVQERFKPGRTIEI